MDQLSIKVFILEASATGVLSVCLVFILALIALEIVWKRVDPICGGGGGGSWETPEIINKSLLTRNC